MVGSKLFKRLRIGIGYDRNFTLHDWVLGKFTLEEKKQIAIISPPLKTSLMELIKETNFEKIMNKYN
jgi:PTH1 family peptidyl-tRNA hydrolase